MYTLIKDFIPPILLKTLNKIRNSNYGWKGDYATWESAKKNATGYDSDEIFHRVKSSLLKVKNGEAVYERDSVIFDEIQYSWQLLAGLMLAAAKNKGSLNVLDFGGSLGSTYYQNKKFLDQLDNVSWNIVEQKKFVDCGKKEFENEQLHFYYDIESCQKEQKTTVLILSSILQYIEKPYELLSEILKYDFEIILIDRTPFTSRKKDSIVLQVVSSNIYNASYPCWIFNKEKFINFLENSCFIIEEFISNDGVVDCCSFEGFILRKSHV